jgi:hypothetical protein
MAQQLLSAGLALSSIWEKARARDRQREVAGDKGQWGFVLEGVKPAAAQAAEWWQGAVLISDYCTNLASVPQKRGPEDVSVWHRSCSHLLNLLCSLFLCVCKCWDSA